MGNPLPGDALEDSVEAFDDTVQGTARWKGVPEVRALAGRSVRLRFVMRDADAASTKAIMTALRLRGRL